jgi:hypothetical protein
MFGFLVNRRYERAILNVLVLDGNSMVRVRQGAINSEPCRDVSLVVYA